MATFLGTLGILAAAGFFFLLFLVPSVVAIFFTTRDFGLLLTAGYWISVCGAWAPYLIGLILFVLIYPLTKAPGEGGMAGLWFIFIGLLMMGIQSVRYVLRVQKGEPTGFWDAARFSMWPYAFMLVLAVFAAIVGLFFMWRDKSGS